MSRYKVDRWERVFLVAMLLLIIGLTAILATCAPAYAQCPNPYCPGGTAVRVYDGGTGAHDAATARRNLGITAGSLTGLRDSLSSIYYSAIQDPLLRVKDAQFWVKDDVDTTKKFQFQGSGILTGTTRTYTMLDQTGTIPLLEYTNAWTANQTFGGSSTFNATAAFNSNVIVGGTGTFYILNSGGSAGTFLTTTTPVDRTNTFPNAEGSILIHGATQPVSGKTLYTGNTIKARDDNTSLHDNGDTTKIVKYDVANITTATTHTDSVPNASTMLAGVRVANSFTGGTQTIDQMTDIVPLRINFDGSRVSNVVELYDAGAGGIVAGFTATGGMAAATYQIPQPGATFAITWQNKSAISANRTYSIDNSISSTDFMMTGGAQTAIGAKTLTGACVISGGTRLNVDGTTARVHFADQTTTTKTLGLNIANIAASTNRTWTAFNLNSDIPVLGNQTAAASAGNLGKRNLTAQTAAIGSTNLTSTALVGMYEVMYYLECTTADVTAGTIQFQANYTDDIGATNQTSAALVLTATGRTSGTFSTYLNSGELSYQTNLTGIAGTSQYALRFRVIYKG